MARIIELDIELTKIDKKKITEKNGRKFYKMTMIETPNGKYGQWMVVEKQTKEERDSREKGNILGNGKNINWGDKPKQNNPPPSTSDLAL